MPPPPIVTIGFPVFNGEQTLRQALDSLLTQTFSDFELLISDNASIDGTELICREYAKRDDRIRYVRQEINLGAASNFKFVLDEALGEYFMWAASDDIRSPEYIEENVKFLKSNLDYVASTSPNGYEGKSLDEGCLVNFAMDGDVYERFVQFFLNCWVSHGIIYSLVRTNVLRSCEIVGQTFVAADWAINLFLASRGKIKRISVGYTVFGVNGFSSGSDAYKAYRNSCIELFFPFYRLTCYVFNLTRYFPLGKRLAILHTLIRLNIKASSDQVFATLYRWYCILLKSRWAKKGMQV